MVAGKLYRADPKPTFPNASQLETWTTAQQESQLDLFGGAYWLRVDVTPDPDIETERWVFHPHNTLIERVSVAVYPKSEIASDQKTEGDPPVRVYGVRRAVRIPVELRTPYSS
jgi:hypothetical protein